MRQAIHQLSWVRRAGRALLLLRRFAQWVTALTVVIILCGLIDYALRLPGWIRLLIAVAIAGLALTWLISRATRAAAFAPSLAALALRAERQHPELAGVLASAVDLADRTSSENRTDSSPITAALAARSLLDAQTQTDPIRLRGLLRVGPTLRITLVAFGVCTICAAVVLAAPQTSRLAAVRWILPLGDAQWPRRTQIVSQIGGRVWPADTPIQFRARVQRGYHTGMRTWLFYRVTHPDRTAEPWQSLLMTEQQPTERSTGPLRNQGLPAGHARPPTDDAQGVFERLVELSASLDDSQADQLPTVDFYFEAGDDRTKPQSLRIVARPEISAVSLDTQPPPYARGLVSAQTLRLDATPGRVTATAALAGSTVELRVSFRDPLRLTLAQADLALPGLAGYPPSRLIQKDAARDTSDVVRTRHPASTAAITDTLDQAHPVATGIARTWVLDRAVETPIRLTDRHGLTNLSQRIYRIDATADQPPTVSITDPPADISVLPTALVEIEALALDDVAVEQLELEARVADGTDQATDGESEAVPDHPPIATVVGRQKRITLQHRYDLQPLGLLPGDTVGLTAVARDVYHLENELESLRHDPTRSKLRRLRIIDVTTFITQIRGDLTTIRRQSVRAESLQRALIDKPTAAAAPDQRRLTQRIAAQSKFLATLRRRAELNRLDDTTLNDLMARAADLLQSAKTASAAADQSLARAQETPADAALHRRDAAERQAQSADALEKLVTVLDQGRDAVAHQMQLRRIHADQQALAQDTAKLLPRTLGRTHDQLSDDDRKALKSLADRQAELAEQARSLATQMRATASALAEQSDAPNDLALAQALAEAAAIAQRQGLAPTMNDAAEKLGENQVSASGSDQQQAIDTLQSMLEQTNDLEKYRHEILRRRLTELADAIGKLIEQQSSQIALVTDPASDAAKLDHDLAALRRNTIAVAERASADKATAKAQPPLNDAADSQAAAITALRLADRDGATQAESQALDQLKIALQTIRKLRQEADAEQAQKQRSKLREAYQQLADRQQQLRDQTAEQHPRSAPTRRQRAELIDLGHRQADVRIAANELGDQAGDALVFNYTHERIDRTAAMIVTRLRAAHTDDHLLHDQDAITAMLRDMAAALDMQTPDGDDFESAEGGAAGGGGAGGSPPPTVPPLAELQLLRASQYGLYQRTRTVDQQPDTETAGDTIRSLSVQQQELADLGRQLGERARREQAGPSLPTPPVEP